MCSLWRGELMVSGGDGWEAGGRPPQILFEGHVMLA